MHTGIGGQDMTGKDKRWVLKGDALVNKVVLIIIEVICAALIFGYISDYMAGYSKKSYFIVFELVAIATAVIMPITYKLKPDRMKNIAFASFALLYAVACYSPAIDLTFVMAFPIVLVFILYYDFKLMCAMAITFMTIIIFDCINILFILKAHHSGLPINSSMLLMEVLGTGIFLASAAVVTNISKRNNDEKISEIQSVADHINMSITNINKEIVLLNESSTAAKQAMEEINSGISGAAEAVQNQMLQTEAIQSRIEDVQAAASEIDNNVEVTMSEVATGNQDMETLVDQADKSVEISDRVIADLNALKDSIEAMGGITQMIESIAFQTNIMALNANVEAARAGEAGRGFAVVASEISNMSAKTKDATDEITDLINNSTSSLDELVASIDKMAGMIRSEKAQTMHTSEIFASIQTNTEAVRANVSLFMDNISELLSANSEIVSSVSTISATTQQVTALASEALNKERQNADTVSSIADQIGKLAQ